MNIPKHLRYSLAGWAFRPGPEGPEAFYAGLKKAGYGAVEMIPPEEWPIARNAGLDVLNISGPGMTEGLNRVENHAALVPEIRTAIQLAGENAIPFVIVFSGNRDGQSDDEGIGNVAAALRQVLPDAEEQNVTLLFEMLNSEEHADYQADTSAYGFRLAETVAHPRLKLLYDIYHMHRMDCDVLADFAAHADLIGHIHLAEAPNRTMPLPDGQIRHAELVTPILETGYTGYWGMEFLPGDTPPLQALIESRRVIEHCV